MAPGRLGHLSVYLTGYTAIGAVLRCLRLSPTTTRPLPRECASLFDRWLPPALRELLRRSSVAPKTLVSPGPSPGERELMIAAALTAPDHERLRPFRFIFIEGLGRERLSRVFMAIKKQRNPRTRQEELARTWM